MTAKRVWPRRKGKRRIWGKKVIIKNGFQWFNLLLKVIEGYKRRIIPKERLKKIATQELGQMMYLCLYVSGHGITLDETGDYYFVPYDAPNGSDITKTGISQDDFKKLISQIRAPKMALLLDTCESGSVASESFSSSIQRFGANTGVAIIAGATSKQNAIDGYKKHGIFTYTVLDAMGNEKVYSFDDKVDVLMR